MFMEQNMSQEQDLFTDYAMQMFASYQSDDIDGMHNLLSSFAEDGTGEDFVFLPGVIFGLLFHMKTMLNMFAQITDMDPKEFLEKYALGYSVMREELLNHPFFSVKEASRQFDEIKNLLREVENINSIEDLFDN